jgi:hypothetical protein
MPISIPLSWEGLSGFIITLYLCDLICLPEVQLIQEFHHSPPHYDTCSVKSRQESKASIIMGRIYIYIYKHTHIYIQDPLVLMALRMLMPMFLQKVGMYLKVYMVLLPRKIMLKKPS